MLNDVKSALSILDQVKEWKILKTLPAKVKELEERIAALEVKPKSPCLCEDCGSSNNKIQSQRKSRHTRGVYDTVRKCGDCGFISEPRPE